LIRARRVETPKSQSPTSTPSTHSVLTFRVGILGLNTILGLTSPEALAAGLIPAPIPIAELLVVVAAGPPEADAVRTGIGAPVTVAAGWVGGPPLALGLASRTGFFGTNFGGARDGPAAAFPEPGGLDMLVVERMERIELTMVSLAFQSPTTFG
jgi:hypothetical protein